MKKWEERKYKEHNKGNREGKREEREEEEGWEVPRR